jgi:hypothetical protein
MSVNIIENFQLGTNLSLDARYVVNSYNDVSIYWYAGMQVFQLSDKKLYLYDGSIWTLSGDSFWTVDNSTLVPQNPDYGIGISSIEISPDSSSAIFVDMQVTSDSSLGSTREYKLMIDGSSALRIWSISNGAGGLLEKGVVIDADHLYIGDPSLNGSWRFGIDSSNNFLFEGKKNNLWNEVLNLFIE